MSLEETINADIKTAMLQKNDSALRGLRAVKQVILLAKTSGGGNISSEDEIKMLQKLIKQRKESGDIYREQKRKKLETHVPYIGPKNQKFVEKHFVFEGKSTRKSGYAVIEFSLKGKAVVVDTGSADAYREDTKRLDDLSYEYVDLTDELGEYFVLYLIALLSFVIGGFALLFIRVRQIKAAESSEADTGTLCPAGLAKFSLLSVSTMGMYSLYWFWRCWRQLWHAEALQISPFWRAFFGGFWVYALFDAARERASYKMASWIGVTIMVLYLSAGAIGYLAESVQAPTAVQIAISLLSAVVLLPIVKQVNAANTPALVAQSSQIQSIHWIILALSLPFTTCILLAS